MRSRHDLTRSNGIKCIDHNTNIMHRLIVLESTRDISEENDMTSIVSF